jgi:hypothetical protein
MNFFKDFQDEIKTFLIVAFIAVILTVGGILLLQNIQPAPSPIADCPADPSACLAESRRACATAASCRYVWLANLSQLRVWF